MYIEYIGAEPRYSKRSQLEYYIFDLEDKTLHFFFTLIIIIVCVFLR